MTERTAILAAGCFWGVETAFRRRAGVRDTRVGYTGGQTGNPGYKQVCTGRTGHAEAVRVVYEDSAVSYRELLDLFFAIHDPTQLNRQGPDIGSQYRSAIFYLDDEQRRAAEAAIAELAASGRLSAPIATEITPAGDFWPAEEEHQRFEEKRGIA